MDEHREPRCSVIIVIVAINGMLSAALGFAAEATVPRIYEVQNKFSHECKYPKSPAQGLGIAAVVTLLIVRCYCSRTRNLSPLVRLTLFSSWVAWLVAMSFYIAGFLMINNQEMEIRYNGFQSYIVCYVVKPGIFAAGASFVLVSIVLEIVYLVATSSRADKLMNDHTSSWLSMVSRA
ncbi:hypothetical protein CTI12_AA507830 [Artemisia annua]|uniref:Uncharacterized protein n=1 Tax=Artemisia annua TaxID=35608 RepID=A0A2U1KYH2_ARTAN|nr:hypothetical protein CTI12_AA549410 [Artemisia annua]PWA46530.1 hypothetical protein CTI12_AA507830 [Artemisia annua]